MDKIIDKLKPYYPNIIEVSYENIKDISFDNIVAFTYASPGAQGDNGAVTIVHKSNSVCFYHINRLSTEDEQLLQMVDNVYFNKLQDIMNDISINITRIFQQNILNSSIKDSNKNTNIDWTRFSMGQGNLLFIKSKHLKDFAKLSDKYLNRLEIYKKGVLQTKVFPYPLRFQMLNLFFSEYIKN